MRSPSTTSPAHLSRRHWLAQIGALSACGAFAGMGPLGARAAQGESGQRPLWLKTLKVGMADIPGSLVDKFRGVKEAGFQGIELDAPNFEVAEVRRAIDETGLVVDGTVCATHWQVRHTDADAKVRAQALETLKEALRKTHAVGGHTVLLVLGHGKDGDASTIWKRAMDNLQLAIPVAAELGVVIAIENVWNHFLYDHQGGTDQTADQFAKFVDEADSPWVGMQFDIGNHWKFGNPAAWIRTLGKRIVKLDIKGFSRAQDRFTKFAAAGDDDLPWSEVRQALLDIHFQGWVAAEVGGGGIDRLREVAQHMDRVLPTA